VAPAGDAAAVVVVVERTLEAAKHVVDLGEAGGFQRQAGGDRALAAAADQHHGARGAAQRRHLADEMRIDVPVGHVVPCDVLRAHVVADEPVLGPAAAVDQDRVGACGEEGEEAGAMLESVAADGGEQGDALLGAVGRERQARRRRRGGERVALRAALERADEGAEGRVLRRLAGQRRDPVETAP